VWVRVILVTVAVLVTLAVLSSGVVVYLIQRSGPASESQVAALLHEARGPTALESFVESVRSFFGYPSMVSSGRRSSWEVARKIADIGPEAVPPLLEALRDPSPEVRETAITALRFLEDPRAVPALIRVLEEDPVAEVRGEAADTLGSLGDARAVEPLIGALDDARADVRAEVADALAYLEDRRAVPPLIRALQDPQS
jgi:HEAT repeat protein